MNKNKFVGLKLMLEKLKGYDIFFTLNEDESGNIFGTYKGVKKMIQSNKKINNQDIMNFMNKQFDQVNKQFDQVNKQFDQVNKQFDQVNSKIIEIKSEIKVINYKIDLMLQTPTMQKEIDHNALADIDLINK